MQDETEEQALLQGLAGEMQDGEPSTEYLLELLEDDVSHRLLTEGVIKALTARAHQLTNLTEEETWEAKYLNMNHFELVKHQFPRRESIFAHEGVRRKCFQDGTRPLQPADMQVIRGLRELIWKEIVQGRDGYLLKQITEQTRRSILEGAEGRKRDKSLKDRMKAGIFGGI